MVILLLNCCANLFVDTTHIMNRHTKIVVVDNRSRATGYAPNDFAIDIVPVHNVIKIELIQAHVSNRLYDIDSYNNVIDFMINGVTYVTAVPFAVYTCTELAVAMVTAMEAVYMSNHPSGTIPVTYDEKTNFLTFSANGGVTLQLLSSTGANVINGIWDAIGFDAIDTSTTTSQRGRYTMQIKEGDNHILLCIENIGNVETSDNIDDVFAVIATNDNADFERIHTVPKCYSVSSPLRSVSKLVIKYRRRDGSLYNMRTSPCAFSLLFTYLN
jgi:hypothetical protein